MLELKGELVFKTVAYHRAADAIERSPVDLVAAYRAGKPPRLPGVGTAISDKIDELATTGRMAYYDRFARRSRRAWSSCLRIPGSGRRPCASSTPSSGIETVDDLATRPRPGASRPSAGCRARPRR